MSFCLRKEIIGAVIPPPSFPKNEYFDEASHFQIFNRLNFPWRKFWDKFDWAGLKHSNTCCDQDIFSSENFSSSSLHCNAVVSSVDSTDDLAKLDLSRINLFNHNINHWTEASSVWDKKFLLTEVTLRVVSKKIAIVASLFRVATQFKINKKPLNCRINRAFRRPTDFI